MSAEGQCIGVCIVDPETGICIGCGRGPDDIGGVLPASAPVPTPASAPEPTPASPAAPAPPGSPSET